MRGLPVSAPDGFGADVSAGLDFSMYRPEPRETGGGGPIALKGNKADSKFVESEQFVFASGSDSNVVVSVDNLIPNATITIDVYYV